MRVRLPKHPFLCNSCVPFQELIYWWFRSNWRFWSILIAHRPFWSFWSISNHFNHLNLFQLFRSILNHFNSFWFILIHFDSFWFILIHFDSFPSISIYFDSFGFWHWNCQNILMARQPFLLFHHVTASKNGAWWWLLPPHFCLFHPHYAGIWHIMADMRIQWWKSGKTTINQW
jgi:hypothetical protein